MSTASAIPDHVYRELFAAAPDGIMLVDQAGTVRVANAECAGILGFSEDDLRRSARKLIEVLDD